MIILFILHLLYNHSFNDGNKNIKMMWDKIKSLYNIAPDKFEQGDCWCLAYKKSDYDVFYLYPELFSGVIKMHLFFREVKRKKKEQKDNEIKKEFIGCIQQEIDKYKKKYDIDTEKTDTDKEETDKIKFRPLINDIFYFCRCGYIVGNSKLKKKYTDNNRCPNCGRPVIWKAGEP